MCVCVCVCYSGKGSVPLYHCWKSYILPVLSVTQGRGASGCTGLMGIEGEGGCAKEKTDGQ